MSGIAPIARVSRDWIGVTIGLTLLLVVLTLSGAAERADNLFYDWSLRIHARPPPGDIVIVSIDDESLAALGPWPWPRSVHAALLRRLAAAEPLAVVYDVLFLGAAPHRAVDDELGRAFAGLPRVFVPMLFKIPGSDGRGYDPQWPVPQVEVGATVGHAMVRPDRDGVVRRLDLALDGTRRWTHIAALAAATGPNSGYGAIDLAPFKARAAERPLRGLGRVLIAYGGTPGRVRTAHFIDVLRGETPRNFLRGRYVLVGSTAPGLGDQFATPVGGESGVMSGIEIQANLLETLLGGRAVVEAPIGARLLLGFPALWLLMLGFLRLRPRLAAWLGVALIGVVGVVSAVLLLAAHLWLPPVATVVVLAVAQPLWAWRRLSGVSAYMIEELSRLAADTGPGEGPAPAPRLGRDHIDNQVDLMRGAVARVRALRRLVTTAVRSLPDPTVLVSPGGEIALANSEAVRLFSRGDGHDAVVPADVERFFSDDGARPFSPISFEAEDRPWRGERTGADGTQRQILHVPWTDDHGEPLGWVVRFADITALRRAEAAREEALQLLTHDMRSPQASILALLSDTAGEVKGDLRNRISHYARRTIDLADGFLRLARADAGDYDRAPVDMNDVMTEAVDDLWALASARDLRILFKPADGEAMILGNRSLLIRVISNLLDNAVKFSRPGGVIRCDVAIQVVDEKAAVVCRLSDQGPGMAPEVVSRLFRRFSRHAKSPGVVEGVGLGLAFVQSVVKGHGGAVSCHSEVGRGTTFEIVLPTLGPVASGHGAQSHEHH